MSCVILLACRGTLNGVRSISSWCSVLNKLYALCDGNPPNVQKVWPDRTEKLRSFHWGNCKLCDLDGRKLCWINWHLTAANCAVPTGLSHSLCCSKRAVRICVAGGINCTKGDPSLVAVTLHSHSRVYRWQPVIQCNVGQTWLLLTAPLSGFANVCSWFIWVHSTYTSFWEGAVLKWTVKACYRVGERGGCVWNLKLPVRGKKPECSVLNKLYALCDGNPPNVQKVWPDQTEKLRSSHWSNSDLIVAKCAVPSGLAHRLCRNKRAVRICVAGGFNCTKGDPCLVAVTLHSHIILQSITGNPSSSTM